MTTGFNGQTGSQAILLVGRSLEKHRSLFASLMSGNYKNIDATFVSSNNGLEEVTGWKKNKDNKNSICVSAYCTF